MVREQNEGGEGLRGEKYGNYSVNVNGRYQGLTRSCLFITSHDQVTLVDVQ